MLFLSQTVFDDEQVPKAKNYLIFIIYILTIFKQYTLNYRELCYKKSSSYKFESLISHRNDNTISIDARSTCDGSALRNLSIHSSRLSASCTCF